MLLAVALPGCLTRTPPSEYERRWELGLRAALPPGWQILVVTGDPGKNRFLCWFEAPGPDGQTRRVELRVSPRPDAPDERDWAVNVHPPPGPKARESVYFVARDDGAGPVEPTARSHDAGAIDEARPLAEEAVRQVRGLGLF